MKKTLLRRTEITVEILQSTRIRNHVIGRYCGECGRAIELPSADVYTTQEVKVDETMKSLNDHTGEMSATPNND